MWSKYSTFLWPSDRIRKYKQEKPFSVAKISFMTQVSLFISTAAVARQSTTMIKFIIVCTRKYLPQILLWVIFQGKNNPFCKIWWAPCSLQCLQHICFPTRPMKHPQCLPVISIYKFTLEPTDILTNKLPWRLTTLPNNPDFPSDGC